MNYCFWSLLNGLLKLKNWPHYVLELALDKFEEGFTQRWFPLISALLQFDEFPILAQYRQKQTLPWSYFPFHLFQNSHSFLWKGQLSVNYCSGLMRILPHKLFTLRAFKFPRLLLLVWNSKAAWIRNQIFKVFTQEDQSYLTQSSCLQTNLGDCND